MKKVIHCGTEDYVQFFEKVVDTEEDFSLVKTLDKGIERIKKAFDEAKEVV